MEARYGNVGNVWNLGYTLSTIDFDAPRSVDASCTSQLTQGLEYEVANLGDPPVANECGCLAFVHGFVKG
jgi:endo-1,3(4)-beta-glucanase